MRLDALTIEASELWAGADWGEAPCLFVRGCESPRKERITLPPCPVILIGERRGGLSDYYDAVVESDHAAQVILDRVIRNPRAAEVLVGLLRLLPGLSVADGLVAESLAYGVLQGGAEHAAWLAERSPQLALAPGAVVLERNGAVLDIAMDRPAADNAIDRAVRDDLAEALRLAALDDTISQVLLRAMGRSFSLGADLAEFGETRDPARAHHIRARTLPAHWAARCADKLSVHVHGACVGAGLEIAAFARRFTASPRAWFQLPELPMGLIPGAGGCVSLTRRIGRQRTAELVLSGRRLSARAALAIGLVDALINDTAANDRRSDIG